MANIINQANKATLEYKTIMGINPQNKKEMLIRPLLVNKGHYDIARCLRFAMDGGYIQGGQFYSNFGIVNGFMEGVQRLGKDGNDILLDGWLRIYPVLKGTCDPVTRQIGPDNELHVCAQCQSNLRRKASEFNWICVDDNSVRSTVQHIQSVGGANDKEIFPGANIVVSGTNLTYTPTTDKITASWTTTDPETGVSTPHAVDLVPESSGYSSLVLPFPEALASAPADTEVTFTFHFRKGDPNATVFPALAKVKLVAAA